MADKLATVSINSKDQGLAEAILKAIRAMPEYAADAAELEKDTRRGGFGIRYEAFVFHV